MLHVTKRIFKKSGFKGFYAGNWTNIVKVIPEAGFKFAIYGNMMRNLEEKSINASLWKRLYCGVVSGAVAHTIIYPLELVRTRIALFDHKYKGI